MAILTPAPSYKRLGYVQVPLTATEATTLTPPAGANYALIVASAAVLWRDDDEAPSTTAGMPMAANAEPQGFSGNLAGMQFIAATGTANLDISWYG